MAAAKKSTARYADVFLLPVSKRKMDAYKKLAKIGARVWLKCGALEYRECAGDDMNTKSFRQFPILIKTKPGETVVVSWIIFKSRAHRDKVNAMVMKDPVFAKMDMSNMPFDWKRMYYGGFKVIVST
jgi:uncharacterized protein YbaA (DUF1428 family)